MASCNGNQSSRREKSAVQLCCAYRWWREAMAREYRACCVLSQQPRSLPGSPEGTTGTTEGCRHCTQGAGAVWRMPLLFCCLIWTSVRCNSNQQMEPGHRGNSIRPNALSSLLAWESVLALEVVIRRAWVAALSQEVSHQGFLSPGSFPILHTRPPLHNQGPLRLFQHTWLQPSSTHMDGESLLLPVECFPARATSSQLHQSVWAAQHAGGRGALG